MPCLGSPATPVWYELGAPSRPEGDGVLKLGAAVENNRKAPLASTS